MADSILSVSALSKRFGALEASRDVSLEVRRGELHALIGPNGAGKTTIIKQISGELLPDSGQIVFDGRCITRMPVHRRAHLGMARSYQITAVFDHLTVQENLMLAIQGHNGHNFRFWSKALLDPLILDEIGPALERIGLAERAGVMATRLSHGEKRQLEVGMALAGHPKLLLLDEPYAGMGPGGARELTRLIRTLKTKVTILLVEHDMEAVFALADRISVLVNGEMIASGVPQAIRDNPAVQNAYLGDEHAPCSM